MGLTAEQQNTITNSVWVVNTILKRCGKACDEDLRQEAILYMCKCLLRYDENKGAKWTTYAFASVSLYVKRITAVANRKDNNIIKTDYEELNIAAKDDIKEKLAVLEVENLMSLCDEEDKQILLLRMQGYKYKEISFRTGVPIEKINYRIKRIKEKYNPMFYY